MSPHTSHTALSRATDSFMAGERVDMQVLASELHVSRTTLYRWVGDRERLMGDILAGLLGRVYEQTSVEQPTQPDDVGAELGRFKQFLQRCASLDPVKDFIRREPHLASRVLMRSDGAVRRAIGQVVEQALVVRRGPRAERLRPEVRDVIVYLALVGSFVPLLVGEPPSTDRVMALCRTVVTEMAE